MRPKARVLLVEDDDEVRNLCATVLRIGGYYVRTAADGLSGLRLLDVFEPDVVILDMRLPVASGFEVLHELRSATKTRDIPVIAISGYERAIDLARVNSDVFCTLLKPFDPEDLEEAVSRAIVRPPL